MSASQESQIRTRMFARWLGPYFAIVPTTVAVRASHMKTLLSAFEASPMWPWVLGAFLLMFGLLIIAFHQYWRGAAAIIVSLLGWFLAVRGLLLLVVPQTYESVGNQLTSPLAYALVRVFFIGLGLVGLYLTYVGWIAAPSRPELPSASPSPDRPHAPRD
jgi:vacuolar-type H+-ATPase subunit I/STV1